MDLVEIARMLTGELKKLSFDPPVQSIYNPLDYAWPPYERYLRLYGKPPKETVLVGMNPGPWGMVQTGVPFGEIEAVRGWMRIEGTVGRPAHQHPKRPVEGFACRRSEVSGRRLWGWARERYGCPERFFARFFVLNYCPLAFFDADGRNLTPDRLPTAHRQTLFGVCDAALAASTASLRATRVIGIGRFAEKRVRSALPASSADIGGITHPSPANPRANKGWSALIESELSSLGVRLP